MKKYQNLVILKSGNKSDQAKICNEYAKNGPIFKIQVSLALK